MRKLALVSALVLAAPVAAHAQVAFVDLGLDLNASNVFDTLFNTIVVGLCGTDGVCQDIVILRSGVHLDATATGTARCTNRGGQTPPPFKQLTIPSVGVTGTAGPPLPNAITTSPPVTPVPNAPDCPATNWAENITDLSFNSATLTMFIGSQTLATITCTFNPATQNGPVPASSVSCTQQ